MYFYKQALIIYIALPTNCCFLPVVQPGDAVGSETAPVSSDSECRFEAALQIPSNASHLRRKKVSIVKARPTEYCDWHVYLGKWNQMYQDLVEEPRNQVTPRSCTTVQPCEDLPLARRTNAY
eukprot:gb/GECG01004377.1/.p1 GENE.gb/GECG01004377.1/~~gb/GECG01004377.1/.p1  ORF type:complete len:122 (+),score=6.04 gb/GECG01004377.1/:1-366(+)